MKAMVIGANGKIGSALSKALEVAGHEVMRMTRKEIDLLELPNIFDKFGHVDVVYLCAAMTRFIDCEDNDQSYRANVDAPIGIALQVRHYAKVIYISSEAVERALHTNYGMHKALAEIGLKTVCNPVIARISKVDPWSMENLCQFLILLAGETGGLYRWHPPAVSAVLKVANA